MKRILMIAFHYPPLRGSTGIQRTLQFSRYLPEFGWSPVVLTASPRAYPQVGPEQMKEIPRSVPVYRVFALDAARHLAIRGAYWKWTAVPDRWASWAAAAIPIGVALVRKHRPDLIWSTYPIATAHLIALGIHRMTGIPWIADCRDSMTEEGYPADPSIRRVVRWIERQAAERAARMTFTAPGTRAMYAARYPYVPAARWALLPNGFDEESFLEAERLAPAGPPARDPLTLVHSGLLYPSERDPSAFFDALADLKRAGAIAASNLRVRLRASGNEPDYRRRIAERGIEDVVRLEEPLPYGEALAEMLHADGLLLFQASNCNHQIPAKLYEYYRARRPIFAMTDPGGDTAHALREAGVDTIAPLDSKTAIARGLTSFLDAVRAERAPRPTDAEIARHSRHARSRDLAALLDAACATT